ncbi:hypothetical protein ENBRE01_0363 [Enteropsectra breve]|nr:hypothetical protein ENBRE01_0363 [Enteropsectra breve]
MENQNIRVFLPSPRSLNSDGEEYEIKAQVRQITRRKRASRKDALPLYVPYKSIFEETDLSRLTPRQRIIVEKYHQNKGKISSLFLAVNEIRNTNITIEKPTAIEEPTTIEEPITIEEPSIIEKVVKASVACCISSEANSNEKLYTEETNYKVKLQAEEIIHGATPVVAEIIQDSSLLTEENNDFSFIEDNTALFESDSKTVSMDFAQEDATESIVIHNGLKYRQIHMENDIIVKIPLTESEDKTKLISDAIDNNSNIKNIEIENSSAVSGASVVEANTSSEKLMLEQKAEEVSLTVKFQHKPSVSCKTCKKDAKDLVEYLNWFLRSHRCAYRKIVAEIRKNFIYIFGTKKCVCDIERYFYVLAAMAGECGCKKTK